MLLVLLLTGLADSFPSQTQHHQDNDYVDINEGALVKVEFSKTLRDALKIFVEIIGFLLFLLLLIFSAESMICVFLWLMLMRDGRNPIYFQCYLHSGMMSAMSTIQSKADNIIYRAAVLKRDKHLAKV